MSKIQIVIPTYNAKEGVVATISGVRKAVPEAAITIVDDNSPDKTANLVKEIFKKDKKVKVIVRKQKGGRGSAILYGFKDALKNKDAQYFIEMDADLVHNPKYIKKLVAKCERADVVIASRYIKGAKIFGWSLKRKLMSRAINMLAKILLNLPVTDYTDGYRCYSRRAVEFISIQTFHATGYVVLSEIAFLCYKQGFLFDELPIHINLQTVSKSNLNAKEIKEAITTIIRLQLSIPKTNMK